MSKLKLDEIVELGSFIQDCRILQHISTPANSLPRRVCTLAHCLPKNSRDLLRATRSVPTRRRRRWCVVNSNLRWLCCARSLIRLPKNHRKLCANPESFSAREIAWKGNARFWICKHYKWSLLGECENRRWMTWPSSLVCESISERSTHENIKHDKWSYNPKNYIYFVALALTFFGWSNSSINYSNKMRTQNFFYTKLIFPARV